MLSEIQISMVKLLQEMDLDEDQLMSVMLLLQDDDSLISLAECIP